MAEFEPIKPLHPLQQEIIKQTNPDNFMDPYDADKVRQADELSRRAGAINMRRPWDVLDLIEASVTDLGCEYPAELVYTYLLSFYKPTNHPNDFDWCNNLCQRLYNVKDDIPAMMLTVREERQKRITEPQGPNPPPYNPIPDLLIAILVVVGFWLIFWLIFTIIAGNN